MTARVSGRIIVTGARPFIDIDAYAGCVAYAELLRLQGKDALASSSSVLNTSVTPRVLAWKTEWESHVTSMPTDSFIIVDISEPAYFDTRVVLDKVTEVIDHHVGHEDYWQQRLGGKAKIEFVGAACTLVYEQWQTSGLLGKMSQTSARLLATGIIDNTLNLRAKLTTDRDKVAFAELMKRADLAEDWPKQYLEEAQTQLEANIDEGIENDLKLVTYPDTDYESAIGQLLVWDGSSFLGRYKDELTAVFAKYQHWYLNILSIVDEKSYFFTEDKLTQQWLSRHLNVTFKENVASTPRFWLRKEIMKTVREAS